MHMNFWDMFSGDGDGVFFFETCTTLLTFICFGQYLEKKMKGR